MKVNQQAEAMLVPLDQLNRTSDNIHLLEIYINRSLHPQSKPGKLSRSQLARQHRLSLTRPQQQKITALHRNMSRDLVNTMQMSQR